MFNNLPEPIQAQILTYFATNNFPAAKDLRDRYIRGELCFNEEIYSADVFED